MLLPWLLLPAYALAAWRGLCHGEPAGRGRLRRSLGTIVVALVAILLGFPILATAGMRMGVPIRWLAASPGSAAAVALVGGFAGSGWIVDIETGRKTRFLPPPLEYALWNEDGSKVAVLTRSGPFGSWADSRIEIYDAKGDAVRDPIPLPEGIHLAETHWVGDDLVAIGGSRTRTEEKAALFFVRVADGALVPHALPGRAWDHWLLGPDRHGKLYLASVTAGAPDAATAPTRLYTVDVSRRAVDPTPVLENEGAGRGAGLSPSGRYWLRVDRGEGIRKAHVVDLETGAEIPGPGIHRRGFWLAGDRLAWVEHTPERARLLVARPAEAPRVVLEWDRACVAPERSPTGDAVLLQVRANDAPCNDANEFDGPSVAEGGSARRGNAPEVLVYEPEGDRVREVPLTSHERAEGVTVRWAGARTLGRIGPGSLTFERVGAP
jgi:hypothetical protein